MTSTVAEDWEAKCRAVLEHVFEERKRQVAQYGFNDDLDDGTGPDVHWLEGTKMSPVLDLRNATEIEELLREQYEEYEKANGLPTWMHLVREEVAEAFKESDPVRLTSELLQVAGLCVSWMEAIQRRAH